MRRIVLVVLAIAVASCGTGTVGTDITGTDSVTTSSHTTAPSHAAPAATTSIPTAATTTTEPATTTTEPAPPDPRPILVFADPTPLTPRILFVDESGTVTRSIPVDRRTPWVPAVADDHHGGIVVANAPPPLPAGSVIWFPADAAGWQIVAQPEAGENLAWPALSVVWNDGVPGLLHAYESAAMYHDDATDLDVSEHRIEVRMAPLTGGTLARLASAESVATFSWDDDVYTSTGSTIEHIGFADGLVMIAVREGDCRRLEFFEPPGMPVKLIENPFPDDGVCRSFLHAALSSDGRHLVVLTEHGDLTVIDLSTGDRLVAQAAGDRFVYDGDRTVAVPRHDEAYRVVGAAVFTFSPGALERTDVTVAAEIGFLRLVGVITSGIGVPASASLVSDTPTTPCSGSDAAALPEQDLPSAVAATRAAIAAAARSCDVLTLGHLAADFLWIQYNVCGDADPVPVTGNDPVPHWYAADSSGRVVGELIEILSAEPELVGDVYWWRTEAGGLSIGLDGRWAGYFPAADPCGTVWCTC